MLLLRVCMFVFGFELCCGCVDLGLGFAFGFWRTGELFYTYGFWFSLMVSVCVCCLDENSVQLVLGYCRYGVGCGVAGV